MDHQQATTSKLAFLRHYFHANRLLSAGVFVAVFMGMGGYALIHSGSAETPVSQNPAVQGDINGDSKVTIADLSVLLGHFNKSGAAKDGDINKDGKIDIADLSILLGNFGKSTGTSGAGAATGSNPGTTTNTTGATGGTSTTAPGSGATMDTSIPGATGACASQTPVIAGSATNNTKLYIKPTSNAATQAAAWRTSRPADAALMDKIAAQPSSVWVGGYTGDDQAITTGLANAASQNARMALVVYGIPHRDGGQYSSGGLPTAEAYCRWIDGLVAKIGNKPVLIVVEPDAVAMSMPDAVTTERWMLLTYAVRHLNALPDAKVYLDAGVSGWKTPAAMIPRLKSAGIDYADGFAVNVSNFRTTESQTTYGRAISAGVGNKPFVIDTSRNGNGSNPDATGEDAWCNPPGRALGTPPTMNTGITGVDALMWFKSPGGSDGACRGNPKAGTWMPEYALELARNAHW